jgi:hypothetical protein
MYDMDGKMKAASKHNEPFKGVSKGHSSLLSESNEDPNNGGQNTMSPNGNGTTGRHAHYAADSGPQLDGAKKGTHLSRKRSVDHPIPTSKNMKPINVVKTNDGLGEGMSFTKPVEYPFNLTGFSHVDVEGASDDDVDSVLENDLLGARDEHGSSIENCIQFVNTSKAPRMSNSDRESGEPSDDYSKSESYSDSEYVNDDSNDGFNDTSVNTEGCEPWRFDPLAVKNKKSWALSKGQSKFVDTYLCDKYVGQTALKDIVLKEKPKPSHRALQTPKLDFDMMDLLPRHAQYPGRSVDTSFKRIQGRLLYTMCP